MDTPLLTSCPVRDVFSDTIFKYVAPLVTYSLVLANTITHLMYHRQLRSTIKTLLEIYQTLESKPKVLKILTLLVIMLFWPFLLIWFAASQFTHGTQLLLLFIDLQICFFAFLVEDSFWILKVKLKKHYKLLIQRSEVGGFLLYFDEPCTKLEKHLSVDLFKLRQVHRQLYDVMTTVNRAYNITALLVIASNHFFFTIYLYCWISCGFPVTELCYTLFELHWIMYLCYRYEALKTVEKETANMVNKFDKSALDIKTRAEFQLFFIQLSSLQMVISPVQMFDLDFTLITSVFTSTITYLMLLQQFK